MRKALEEKELDVVRRERQFNIVVRESTSCDFPKHLNERWGWDEWTTYWSKEILQALRNNQHLRKLFEAKQDMGSVRIKLPIGVPAVTALANVMSVLTATEEIGRAHV